MLEWGKRSRCVCKPCKLLFWMSLWSNLGWLTRCLPLPLDPIVQLVQLDRDIKWYSIVRPAPTRAWQVWSIAEAPHGFSRGSAMFFQAPKWMARDLLLCQSTLQEAGTEKMECQNLRSKLDILNNRWLSLIFTGLQHNPDFHVLHWQQTQQMLQVERLEFLWSA